MILYYIIVYDIIWYYVCIYIILTYVHIYNMTQLLQNEMNEYIYIYMCIHVYMHVYIIEITNKIILDTYLIRHILKIHLKNLETFLGFPILTGFMRRGKMPSIDFLVPQKRWSSLGVQSNCRMVLVSIRVMGQWLHSLPFGNQISVCREIWVPIAMIHYWRGPKFGIVFWHIFETQ